MTKYVAWMRHGHYDQGKTQLNSVGELSVKETAGLLKEFFENKDGIILHSKYPRAKQTAEIVHSELGLKDNPLLEESLYTSTFNMVLKTFPRLQKLSNENDFAIIVTHQPDIDSLGKDLGVKNIPEFVMPASGIIVEYNSWNDVSIEKIKDAKVIASFSQRGIVPV